jgi:hypothetical protein
LSHLLFLRIVILNNSHSVLISKVVHKAFKNLGPNILPLCIPPLCDSDKVRTYVYTLNFIAGTEEGGGERGTLYGGYVTRLDEETTIVRCGVNGTTGEEL